jgi:small-conductance mechanosensitive channel
MTGFGNNSVDWEIGVWMEDPWDYRRASSQLHEAVWVAFQDKKIVIAFPQLDLHLDQAVTGAVQKLALHGG